MRLSLVTALIAFTLMILMMAVVPLIITLIYKHFYNRHVNRTLETGGVAGRWLAPFLLFVILFLIEVMVVVGMGMVSSLKNNTSAVAVEECCDIMAQDQIDDSVYSDFNGSEVNGYEMTEEESGDFTYLIYENTRSDLLPAYVLRITYNGTEEIHSWDDTIVVDSAGAGAMGEWEEGDGNVMYAVISDSVEDSETLTFELNLYTEKMEDYDTGNLGTYDMPEATASLSITLR